MEATLERNWRMLDGDQRGKTVVVPAGRHELERIDYPFGSLVCPWLVLKGTKIGMGENAWRHLSNIPTSKNNGRPKRLKREITIKE